MNRPTISFAMLALLLAMGRIAIAADETNSAPRLDFPAFKIISDRNIFNPNRSGRNPNADSTKAPKQVKIDSFALLGTLSYEKGRFAFFDGSSSDYKRALKPADTIAGYKVTEITPSYVKLTGTNNQTINLLVGMQMKRQEEGPWSMGERPEEPVSSGPAAGSDHSDQHAGSPPSEAMSDVMKRLMQKREQESK
jgi:hypothetical protein